MTGRQQKVRAKSLACVTAALMLAQGVVMAQTTPQAVGVASSVVKDVKVSNARAPRPRQVAVRQRMALADYVQTGKASQMQILLLDRSTFSIGANAALRIDRFVYDPARGRSAGAAVVRGAFRFMSGQSNRQNSATVDTPVASIGIRGTMLDGVVGKAAQDIAREEIRAARKAKTDKKTATLVVLRGPGPGTDPREQVGAASVSAGGVTVELTGPTQAVFVPRAGAAPIGPFAISASGIARLNDLIQPALVEKSGGGLLGGLLIIAPIVAGAALNGGGDDNRTGGSNPNSQPTGSPGTSNYPGTIP